MGFDFLLSMVSGMTSAGPPVRKDLPRIATDFIDAFSFHKGLLQEPLWEDRLLLSETAPIEVALRYNMVEPFDVGAGFIPARHCLTPLLHKKSLFFDSAESKSLESAA
jgi:hypothetical protein